MSNVTKQVTIFCRFISILSTNVILIANQIILIPIKEGANFFKLFGGSRIAAESGAECTFNTISRQNSGSSVPFSAEHLKTFMECF